MANRHTLSVNKLDDFKSWLTDNGWQVEKTKGDWEVLRAKKSGRKHPLIVYERIDNENGTKLTHLTVLERDMGVVGNYLKTRRRTE